MPRSTSSRSVRASARASYQALSPGSAFAAAMIARARRASAELPFVQRSTSASSITVTAATSWCAAAMLRAIALLMPRWAEGASLLAVAPSPRAARFTSSVLTVPPGPLGSTLARSTFRLRASARTAGVALTSVRGAAAAFAGAALVLDFVPRSPTIVPLSAAAPSKPTSGAPTWILSPGAPKSLSTLPA